MSALTGESTAEIDAPLAVVWAAIEDVAKAPQWQGGLHSLDVRERDGEGRPTLCVTETDAKIKTITSTVRFAYDEAPTTLRWTQVKGELKAVDGAWLLEDLGGDRTRATYRLDLELGRMLGMLARGPVVDQVRAVVVGPRAEELKRYVEG